MVRYIHEIHGVSPGACLKLCDRRLLLLLGRRRRKGGYGCGWVWLRWRQRGYRARWIG